MMSKQLDAKLQKTYLCKKKTEVDWMESDPVDLHVFGQYVLWGWSGYFGLEEKTTIVMLFSMYTSTKLVVGPDILGEILFVVTVGFDGGLGRVPIPIIRGGQVDGYSRIYLRGGW